MTNESTSALRLRDWLLLPLGALFLFGFPLWFFLAVSGLVFMLVEVFSLPRSENTALMAAAGLVGASLIPFAAFLIMNIGKALCTLAHGIYLAVRYRTLDTARVVKRPR